MYNKLFTKILDSSIWLESTPTRLVWITMIAAMDEDGMCQFASVANLAHRARVTKEEAESAIACLESEDVDSSDPENEGRRIERVPGGWIVLNARKYRELVTREVVKEKTRARVARFREKKACNAGVTHVKRSVTPSETDTDTQAEAKAKAEAEALSAAKAAEATALASLESEAGKDHKKFCADWCAYYETKTGQKYPFQAKDGVAAAKLLKHFGGSEKLKAFIKSCHEREREGFPFASLGGLAMFWSQLGVLQDALKQPSRRNGTAVLVKTGGAAMRPGEGPIAVDVDSLPDYP